MGGILGKVFKAARRAANSKPVKWVALPLGLLLFLRACVYEPYLVLDVNRIEIPARKWNAEISGLKAAVVSDLHAGNRPLERWRLERAVAKINAEKPDIVFLLGDFVNGFIMSAMPPDELAEILGKIEAPLGKFAVIGNHDIGFGPRTLAKGLSKAGIRFLNNESERIAYGGSHFYVAGGVYTKSKYYNFRRILAKVPEGDPVILLLHSPDPYPALPEKASIVFAGHTHGGQIRLPMIGAMTKSHSVQPDNRESGLFISPRGVPMYVTSGVGTATLTMRLFCPPQIDIVTIKSREPAEK